MQIYLLIGTILFRVGKIVYTRKIMCIAYLSTLTVLRKHVLILWKKFNFSVPYMETCIMHLCLQNFVYAVIWVRARLQCFMFALVSYYVCSLLL